MTIRSPVGSPHMAGLLLLLAGICACSPSRDAAREDGVATESAGGVRADSSPEPRATSARASDSLDATLRQATIQVARVAPEIEEGGVAFDVLGGTSALHSGDILYADGPALLSLMKENGSLVLETGRVAIDGVRTDIRGYSREGVVFVAVEPFARHFRGVVMTSPHRPGSATIWPRSTLVFLKQTGDTAGGPYQQAKREGLLP